MLTRDQISKVRIHITSQGDIFEIGSEGKPSRLIGHLEELDYTNLMQSASLQFNALTLIREAIESAIEVLERADFDLLSQGFYEVVSAIDLAQRCAIDGPLSLFVERKPRND